MPASRKAAGSGTPGIELLKTPEFDILVEPTAPIDRGLPPTAIARDRLVNESDIPLGVPKMDAGSTLEVIETTSGGSEACRPAASVPSFPEKMSVNVIVRKLILGLVGSVKLIVPVNGWESTPPAELAIPVFITAVNVSTAVKSDGEPP